MKRSYSVLAPMVAVTLGILTGCAFTPVIVENVKGPEELLIGQEGTFTAEVNADATQPVNTGWDCGDESAASGLVATHAFADAGTFDVVLSVSNQKRRKSSSVSRSLTVEVVPPVAPPQIIRIDRQPDYIDTRTLVEFRADVRGDDREVTGYSWSFGDGTTSVEDDPSHMYESPGSFTVTLGVSNSAGTTSSRTALTVSPYESPACVDLANINFSPAYFDRNSSVVSPDGIPVLQDNAQILADCPSLCVVITGFGAPGERRIDALAMARAGAVRLVYVENGVAAGRASLTTETDLSEVSQKDAMRLFQKADSTPLLCADIQ